MVSWSYSGLHPRSNGRSWTGKGTGQTIQTRGGWAHYIMLRVKIPPHDLPALQLNFAYGSSTYYKCQDPLLCGMRLYSERMPSDRLRGSSIHSAAFSTSPISGSYPPPSLPHALRISLSTAFTLLLFVVSVVYPLEAPASIDATVCTVNFGRDVCIAGGMSSRTGSEDGGAETCDTLAGPASRGRIPVHICASASKKLVVGCRSSSSTTGRIEG